MIVHDGMRCVAPLLEAMKVAEEISRDVTRRQAGMASDPALRAALLAQSRQEAVHASAFGVALKLVAWQAAPPRGLLRALSGYRARLEADLDQGRLASSLLGLQVVFESLGVVALRPPAGALSWSGERLLPMRSLMMRQEEAHHALGEASLARMVRCGQLGVDDLDGSCRAYAALAFAAVEGGISLLDAFPADQEAYWQDATVRIDAIRTRYG